MNLPDDFVFSQSSLQDYVDCPRRFELRYIQRLRWPAVEADPVLEHEQQLLRGERFHHLIHQHIVGVPADKIGRQIDDPVMRRWWETYLLTGLTDVPAARQPEITLSAPLGDYRLLAKYDLLAIEPGGKALIVDWKTAPTTPKRDWLDKRLQTVAYRCVLALAGADVNGGEPIPPERIKMVYWYASGQAVHFPYDAAQFAHDQAFLLGLFHEIDARADFPLTPDTRRCAFCTYRSLCDRGRAAGKLDDFEADEKAIDSGDDFQIDLDQIAEIEF